MIADFQVQVGRPGFDGAAQEIVNIDGHGNVPSWIDFEAKLACVLGRDNDD